MHAGALPLCPKFLVWRTGQASLRPRHRQRPMPELLNTPLSLSACFLTSPRSPSTLFSGAVNFPILGTARNSHTIRFILSLFFCVSPICLFRIRISKLAALGFPVALSLEIPFPFSPHHTYAMPPQLLPASAAAFAPRANTVNVVLSSKVEPWLTQTLKRINRIKRPLNSVPQHQRCLTETLSSSTAIWTLTSLMLPKAPDSELRKDSNPLIEALFNYQILHVEAYIVHVDMVLRNEVAFKLTPDSIESLIEYHKDIHCVDISANTYSWSEKEMQVKKLHEEFIQAINKFVYRTHVTALEGLEEDGAGELLCGKSEEVKNNITALFLPLLPPPPRIVDVVRQPPLLPSSPAGANWWSQSTLPSSIPAPVDSWRVIPSSPSTTSSVDSNSLWASMGLTDIQLPSPTPSYSQPYSTSAMFYSSPQVSAPIPSLPLPSMLAQQPCGISVGYGGFNQPWDRYQEYATTM